MIPTSPSHSVSWSPPTAPAVTPVPAVVGVAPAAAASREQAGLEQRRGQPRTMPVRETDPTPAEAAVKARDEQAEERARTRRSEEQAQRAREQAQAQQEAMEQLRAALRKVWDASGAVVEQAMARDADAAGQQAARAKSADAYGQATPTAIPGNLSKRV